MADVNLTWGHIEDGNEVVANIQSVRPPFQRAFCMMVKELLVGTDFTSGDNVIITIPGIDEISFCSVKNNVGGEVAYAEAAVASVSGRKITITGPTTNLKIFLITDV